MKLTKLIIEHWKIWMSVPVATNIFGSYDEDEQPSWEFFNHINCNYPLTYRMTTGKK